MFFPPGDGTITADLVLCGFGSSLKLEDLELYATRPYVLFWTKMSMLLLNLPSWEFCAVCCVSVFVSKEFSLNDRSRGCSVGRGFVVIHGENQYLQVHLRYRGM